MTQGGGFCERHGPYDPPHRTCPFCAIEADERRAYGPPGPTARRPTPDEDFVRQTVEDDAAQEEAGKNSAQDAVEVTEVMPRALSVPEESAPPDGARALPPGPPEPIGWLAVREPSERRGEMLRVLPNQTIGREGDVRWNDPRLSRVHARFTLEPPEDAPDAPPAFHLWPFAPTNPVFINGRAVRGATPLRENDEIRLGNTLFVFKVLTD